MSTLLLVSGSLRDRSTNTAVIRTAATLVEAPVEAVVYTELGDLPHFDPDVEAAALPDVAARLRAAIEDASAVLICTPEYAGDLPGSFKNLLDWTVGGMETVGKPTAWFNASGNATEARGAHAALRTVLTYTGAAIVEEACRHVPVGPSDIDDGVVTTPAVLDEIRDTIATLLRAAEAVADS